MEDGPHSSFGSHHPEADPALRDPPKTWHQEQSTMGDDTLDRRTPRLQTDGWSARTDGVMEWKSRGAACFFIYTSMIHTSTQQSTTNSLSSCHPISHALSSQGWELTHCQTNPLIQLRPIYNPMFLFCTFKLWSNLGKEMVHPELWTAFLWHAKRPWLAEVTMGHTNQQ